MKRSEFLRGALGTVCVTALAAPAAASEPSEPAGELARVRSEHAFVLGWLSDLLDTVEAELDEPARRALLAGCGRGCFRRHAFKQDIAAAGAGSVEKLVAAYERNFEVWRADDGVHIRYGEISRGCYCPVAKAIPPRPGDLHCECTRATHRSIFETALGRPVEVDVLESVRRGGRTCHFLARV